MQPLAFFAFLPPEVARFIWITALLKDNKAEGFPFLQYTPYSSEEVQVDTVWKFLSKYLLRKVVTEKLRKVSK